MRDPITNEDGHTVSDLRPAFSIPTLEGYLDETELLDILDVHSEETIFALETNAAILELAATAINRLFRDPIASRLIGSIIDNSRDLATND